MSARNVFPPDNSEVDVKPGGTTIGAQAVQGSSTTQISPQAIGPVASFNLVHEVNGVEVSTPVTGVRIPFGTTRLQISNVSGNSQWQSGGTVLTAYASRTSRDWPSALVTPSISSTNNQVSYTTATEPTSPSAIWVSIAYADFTAAQIQITQPA